MKLGRLRSIHDKRTLWLSSYLVKPVHLPAPPLDRDWSPAVTVPWGMMKNDEVGDCVLAAAGHAIMQWSFNAGHGFTPSDADILKAYSDVGGYVPGDSSTDNGADPLTALKYWRKVGIGGHKIGAFLAINPGRPDQFVHAINLFECAYLALGLPLAAQEMKVWDVPTGQKLTGAWEPWSWGGHMVESPKYDAGGIPVVTWGELKTMTWRFLLSYCDEAYIALSEDMLNEGKSPLGFDMEALKRDLKEVTRA